MEALSPLTRVRVRFAHSPTGFLHVGNARTALFNWLVARHLRGAFILRIEDTDAERSRPEYETQLMDDLRWLGLEWDEGVDKGCAHGPYRQTDRYSLYRDHAERLLAQGRAFPCFCTEEELEEVRRQQSARGDMPRYSGKCRNLTSGQVEAFQQAGKPSVLRLRVRPGTVGFSDLVYGRIDIDTLQISDPVLLRSDGSPTYNFSVVVDDIAMEISHVIRGDGHISNTHRQILIYEALPKAVATRLISSRRSAGCGSHLRRYGIVFSQLFGHRHPGADEFIDDRHDAPLAVLLHQQEAVETLLGRA